jgi:hypothetical protein
MSENKDNKPEITVDSDDKKTFTQELEVVGGQLVERIQELIKKGNARRIVVRNADDKVMMEISVTIAVVAGVILVLTPIGWVLAALGVIAAIVARVKIEIVREVTEDSEVVESKKKIDIDGE